MKKNISSNKASIFCRDSELDVATLEAQLADARNLNAQLKEESEMLRLSISNLKIQLEAAQAQHRAVVNSLTWTLSRKFF